MDRDERRRLGLCTHGACVRPVVPGRARCQTCLDAVRASGARFRARGGSRGGAPGRGDRLGPYMLKRENGQIVVEKTSQPEPLDEPEPED